MTEARMDGKADDLRAAFAEWEKTLYRVCEEWNMRPFDQEANDLVEDVIHDMQFFRDFGQTRAQFRSEHPAQPKP